MRELLSDKTTGVRVLFTGQYWPGANTVYIARAFERCGAIVRLLNDTTLWPEWVQLKGRISRRLLRPVIESEWNHQLLKLVNSFRPDLVYLSNADYCWPKTVQNIREQHIPTVCFYHDVQWNQRPGSRFSQNINHFDLVATIVPWHVAEFKAAGAKEVFLIRFGYEPLVHRPLNILGRRAEEYYGADVTFVGTCEGHRAAELNALVIRDFPYHFRLWGNQWDNLPSNSSVRQYWQKKDVHEAEIPIIYATSKVALHWIGWEPHGKDSALRKGTEHNSRTFQIPACGGAIMLAQRTGDHLRFFTEDVEAVYFDDVNELREKLAYWLDPARDQARRHMAAAALARCIKEDYSYVPITRSYLEHFGFPVATEKI